MQRTNIVFIISSLAYGGAQMMLYKHLSALNRKEFYPVVISLTDIVPQIEKFQDIGVDVHILSMKRGVAAFGKIKQLVNYLREDAPHLVHTWMYHSDLLGGLAGKAVGVPVIWNIRHSDLNRKSDKRSTILTARACAVLSKSVPERIVCCAETARDIHVEFGYSPKKFMVIPNGFDLTAFAPNASSRRRIREELGLSDDHIVIGMAARFHPQKDHRNIIRAAALLNRHHPQTRFILCGDEITSANKELTGWIREVGMEKFIHLIGRRSDMADVTNAFDIGCSSSRSGEAFSNVLGEAMACGAPCVATNVGDAALIIGNTGEVVSPCDSGALAAALGKICELDLNARKELGRRARERVLEHFSLKQVNNEYEELYRTIDRRTSSTMAVPIQKRSL